MKKYANSIEEAKKIADEMKKQEPEYSEDVEISETWDDELSFGIFARTDLGKYVISNETE